MNPVLMDHIGVLRVIRPSGSLSPFSASCKAEILRQSTCTISHASQRVSEISDDYENLHQITKQVDTCSSDCGVAFETDEILLALSDLLANDLAKAYRLSNTAEELRGMPSAEVIGSPNESMIGDVYFWVTEKGRLVLTNYDDDDWPFDHDNILRADWKPPQD